MKSLHAGTPRALSKAILALAVCSLGLGSCTRPEPGPWFSATQQAVIPDDPTLTRNRIAAVRDAERRARDQILSQVMSHRFANGITLEDAVVADPFLRAKVYDTIRAAKLADQTVQPDTNIVTVTVQLDMGPVQAILDDPTMLPRPAFLTEPGGRSEELEDPAS